MALVAHALEVAGQVDEESQLFLRVDQPWGDYQARGQHQLSPLQFVDALLRSGVGLSAVNLEFGVKFNAKAGVVFASVDSEAIFKVSITWKDPGPASAST